MLDKLVGTVVDYHEENSTIVRIVEWRRWPLDSVDISFTNISVKNSN